MPGRNLWPYGDVRDYRWDAHEYLDTNLKPMSSDLINFGVDWEIFPQIVFSGRYTRNKLNRTIEDMGVLDERAVLDVGDRTFTPGQSVEPGGVQVGKQRW